MEDQKIEAGDQSAENKPSEKEVSSSTEASTKKEETIESQLEDSVRPEENEELPAQQDASEVTEEVESSSADTEVAEVSEEAAHVVETETEKESEEPTKEESSKEVPVEDKAEAQDKEATEAEKESEVPANEEESSKEEATEEKTESPDKEETVAETATAEEKTDEADAEDEDDEEEQEGEEEIPDFTTFTRDQLVEQIEELSHLSTFKRTQRILDQIVPMFYGMEDERKALALAKYKEGGGEADDFEFRHDEDYNRFDASLTLIRDRRAAFYKEREAAKTRNLEKKEQILEQLRELIDGEQATTNLNPIKKLQEEWKAVGQVPPQHNRTLWANYNALLDRFYNNRHILFELKELDRKKNHKAKLELCVKAEALDSYENIKDAVIELNELHEEYKRIGAVPREVQEELWQRFKTASDKIYKKRKGFLEDLKGEFEENASKKIALAEELKPFLNFDSDRINDWNAKTKEILAIQKRWDAIGGVPREQAKKINKLFWSTFKKFFANKNEFFKRLESLRKENLAKKEQLVEQAVALSESENLDGTAEKLKQLQKQWKDIGPVPEKFRNAVYTKFKEACDQFFDKKRAAQSETEAEFQENLKAKEAVMDKMTKSAKGKKGSAEELSELLEEFNAIGFVPRNSIKSTDEKLKTAVEAYIQAIGLSEEDAQEIMLKAEFGGGKTAAADKKIGKKESMLRRKIKELEDNMALWNNNLAFFANSKTADKLKAEFDEKIDQAKEEVEQLKKQLKVLRNL